jgi:hypothetical protein
MSPHCPRTPGDGPSTAGPRSDRGIWCHDTCLRLPHPAVEFFLFKNPIVPGQQEIDLRYADALSTADNIMTFPMMVKEVTLSQRTYASGHDSSGAALSCERARTRWRAASTTTA